MSQQTEQYMGITAKYSVEKILQLSLRIICNGVQIFTSLKITMAIADSGSVNPICIAHTGSL